MNFTLFALNSLHFLNDGIRTVFVSLLPFIAQDLHIGLTIVGLLGAAQGFLAAILSIPAGLISNKFSGFSILLISLLVYSIGAVGVALSPNLSFLIPIFFLAVSGFGVFHALGYALTAHASTDSNRGRNMGNFTAVGDIGRSIIPTIALFLAVFIGWRSTMIGIAILGIALFFIFRYYLQIKNNHLLAEKVKTKQQTSKEWMKEMYLLLHDKKMRLVTIGACIDAFAGTPIYIFLPFFILARGINPELLGMFTGAYFVGSLIGKTVLGRAVDKFGNAKIFIMTEICMGVALLLLTFLYNIFALVTLSFFLGLFTRGTTPVVATLFSKVVEKKQYEKVFAISITLLEFTGAISPIVLGLIADKFGLVWIFYISAFLAFISIMPIILYARLKQ